MLLSAKAYQLKQRAIGSTDSSGSNRGIWIALAGGLVAGFFFWITSKALAKDLVQPESGLLTPYTGFASFAIGAALSNPLVEYIVRRFASTDREKQVNYEAIPIRKHLIGSGGLLWGIGMIALLLGSKQAGDAISYGLSQGATIVSVFWVLFAWHEFKGAPAKANNYLWMMGAAYLAGLVFIVLARS